MSNKYRQVLQLYKQLNRTVQKVFQGDQVALVAGHDRIHQDFVKNRNVSGQQAIDELIVFGQEVDLVMRKQVLQLERTDDNDRFKLNVRDETHMNDNTMYRDDIPADEYKKRNREARKSKKCKDVKDKLNSNLP
jgi:complex III assembly factor LYRM7